MLPVRSSATEETRYASLERALRLALLLNGRPFCPPIADMAKEIGVSTRTTYRYLDALSIAGFTVPPTPAEYDRDANERRARRIEDFRLSNVRTGRGRCAR